MGLTMGVAEVIAQDRKRWRNDSVSLCPTWDKEDKKVSIMWIWGK